MTEKKKTLFMRETQQEAFPQTFMDRTAKMVASALKAEFCRIFRLSHGCIDLPENQLFIQEIGCIGQPEKLNELAGGISVFIRSQGTTSMVVTLYRTGPDEFAPEEVRFLRYILSLVLKVQKCTKVDIKLQDRILFLESLLENAPDPAYFKDVTREIQSHIEFPTEKSRNFLNKKTTGSMHELEEVIPKSLTAIYKRKTGGSSGVSGELSWKVKRH